MWRFDICGWTDRGSIRVTNEDHILVDPFIVNEGGRGLAFDGDDARLHAPGVLLAVADGIGGLSAGAEASRLCLLSLATRFREAGLSTPCHEALQAAGAHANGALLNEARRHPEWHGTGCTLAGVCLVERRYVVFHAGDSRVYRLRKGFAKLLTVDDTITQRAVEAGRLSAGEAARADVRHTVTNSFGSPSYSLHVTEGPEWRGDDALLICSDGLHDMMDTDTLEHAAAEGTAETRVHHLIDAALAAGGYDNVSAIMVCMNEQ